MKHTILVTGGAGFIGSHLVEALGNKKTNTIIVFDNLSTGSLANIPNQENVVFVEGNVHSEEDIAHLFSNFQFDYIYHLAAIASVAESVNHPLATHQVNMDATIYLLEATRAQEKTVLKFVFASSAAVYGAEPTLPKTELSVIDPITPYGIDKYASEKYVTSYGRLYGLNVAVARFFNVYGPRQNPSSPYSGVLSILTEVAKQVKQGQEASFHVFGDGEQVRDFVFVNDIVQGLMLLGTKSGSQAEAFNIGSGEKHTLRDIITVYETLLETKIPLTYCEARTGDIKYSYASIEKIIQLGYKPTFTIHQGLEKYMADALVPMH
ncbi:NAD-dependent epimerase/dehydratase family protein [Listeria booriae]|uniref:NAD-dependent epimerase/dehydratase family protein n=1 Tax=Listeria booriae TaxID=1552123 RepID=A0A7X0Z8A0_9LIST|nr:NAD-dependent epimerase/dehydratase family protein [Listeria booriae]MBC2177770.1 NAD-dependent epimerase/dehydratase family protein [Listeria booriae]MBC2177809.1 NAD-dependent epimerase/dehydratase family protein [Listeria booriae]